MVIELLVVVLVAIVLVVVFELRRKLFEAPRERIIERTLVTEHAKPSPTPARPADEMVTVRFCNDNGVVIGEQQIPRRFRRPTAQWRQKNGELGVFVADRMVGNIMHYRKVGKERES